MAHNRAHWLAKPLVFLYLNCCYIFHNCKMVETNILKIIHINYIYFYWNFLLDIAKHVNNSNINTITRNKCNQLCLFVWSLKKWKMLHISPYCSKVHCIKLIFITTYPLETRRHFTIDMQSHPNPDYDG